VARLRAFVAHTWALDGADEWAVGSCNWVLTDQGANSVAQSYQISIAAEDDESAKICWWAVGDRSR
jgi:hypothetical protein